MRIIETHKLTPSSFDGKETEKLWAYNGLDCCLTVEIHEAISPQLDNQTNNTYRFSMDLMGPCLEMAIRGVKIDIAKRDELIAAYGKDLEVIIGQLNTILIDGLDLRLNWRSGPQLKNLFYNVLDIPEILKRNDKGEMVPTVNRDALEKLYDNYIIAKPFVSHILAARDFAKKISALETEVDPDIRMRTSYNIAGTTTGRLSSSMNDFGTGGNFQNLEERLRRIFISDPGMKFAYIDLEQAESRLVGAIIWNIFGDPGYLDACESGDLHTYVCKLTNPQLPWTGNPKEDKEIAERPFYRQHSFRHMNKVLGHGSNYLGTPNTLSKHTKIPAQIIKEFQAKYFGAFPGIKNWHTWVENQIRDSGVMTSLMGRRRHFFGRRNDPTTFREAVAFDPQGSVADILNTGMLKVWRSGLCQLLMQIHDAILVQYPEELEDEVLPKILKLIEVPVELNGGRRLLIPSEAKTGWNWSNEVTQRDIDKALEEKRKPPELNPNGLRKYSGHDPRTRAQA